MPAATYSLLRLFDLPARIYLFMRYHTEHQESQERYVHIASLLPKQYTGASFLYSLRCSLPALKPRGAARRCLSAPSVRCAPSFIHTSTQRGV